jgi:hypothetical protein
MNCRHFKNSLIQGEDGDLGPDLQQHLHQCASCEKYFKQLRSVRDLISLKKYERPAAGFEQRSLLAIHRRLQEADRGAEEIPSRIWGWLTGGPAPAFRYAVATAFVVLITLHVLTVPQLPLIQPIAFDVEQAPASGSQKIIAQPRIIPPAISAESMAAYQLASNRGPRRIEYGPFPATMVNFEY